MPGTVTWLAPVGSTVARGQPVYAVDTRPVVRLPGAAPAWRDLGPSSADGIDVRQLEQALTDLGHTTGLDLTVDEDWTAVTTIAVEAVAEVAGRRARRARSGSATCCSRRRTCASTSTWPTSARSWSPARRCSPSVGRSGSSPSRCGPARPVWRRSAGPRPSTLPDGTSTDGTITATAVVTVDEQPQLQVTITADRHPRSTGWREGTPVEVGLDQTVATDVLVVP